MTFTFSSATASGMISLKLVGEIKNIIEKKKLIKFLRNRKPEAYAGTMIVIYLKIEE